MAFIFKKLKVNTIVGFTCDKCGVCVEDDHCNNHFHIAYTFGYGSLKDNTFVEAVICEDCLEIILSMIPNAKYSS